MCLLAFETLTTFWLFLVFTFCNFMGLWFSVINIFSKLFISTLMLKLPSWACAIKTKKPGLADQQNMLEFLISSPVHPPVPYCLHPENGLLLSGTGDGSSPENQADYITTRLEACSQVRKLEI